MNNYRLLHGTPKATQNKILVSQTFICEKRCRDEAFYFIFFTEQAHMHEISYK